MELKFGYGTTEQVVNVEEKNLLDVLMSNPVEHERRGADAVKFALDNPLLGSGAVRLSARQLAGKKIVIVTSDISRPCPSAEILPPVLDELYAAGAKDEDICIVFALGSHRHHTEEEKRRLAGDAVYSRIRCTDSDPDDCIHIGTTSRGTPVDITRTVAEADCRICLGNVEFHYFAGYSGGYKAIMPGASTPAAIQANHKMMLWDGACAGKLEGNPIREDIEEAGRMLGVDYIVNVVLDEHRGIVYAAAGDPVLAHRDACRYLDKMYIKPVARKADIVIAAQGGAPKDANLYQLQKALDNARHAVKDGGTVILIGACSEGLGNKTFGQWFAEADSPAALTERISREFVLGGHKAAAIAKVLELADIYLVSEMDPAFVESLFMKPYSCAAQAYADALKKHGADARVLAMPFAGATLPVVG